MRAYIACAIVVSGALAQAEPVSVQAPWLKPWGISPPAPDLDPILADGNELSLQVASGVMTSTFSKALAFAETASFGHYVASSTKQALSFEAIERVDVSVDHVTPTVAMLGAAARRIGRRNLGSLRTVDLERIALGLAFESKGASSATGLAAGFSFGVLGFEGSGLEVTLQGHFFDPSAPTGPETMFLLTVGYVYSPILNARPSPPTVVRPPRPPPSGPSCRDLPAYIDRLAHERRLAVDACNRGALTECETRKQIVTTLSAKAAACEAGQDVGPPPEIHDAPAP